MAKRAVAASELLLILPASLFLIAVVARHLQPLEVEPAHTFQEIVTWYSLRPWTLWTLLIALPLTALLNGCGALLRDSTGELDERRVVTRALAAARTEWPRRLIVAATVAAGLILAVVALHMLAN